MSIRNRFVSGLDLRKISHMLALADHRSFSEAARALNITQSALSRSIQSLEAALDTKLFERTTREVSLTPEGRLGLEAARRILSSAAEFHRSVRAARVESRRELSIGMASVTASALGPLLLRSITRDQPGLSLGLKVDAAEVLYDLLLAEDVDVVIGTTETMPHNPEFRSETVGMFPRGFFARAGHPLAGRQVSLEDLAAFSTAISFPLPDQLIRTVERTYGLSSLSSLFQLKSNHYEALLDLILSSDTIVFGASIAYLNMIRSGQVLQLDTHPVFPDDMPLTVTQLAGRQARAAEMSLIRILKTWGSTGGASHTDNPSRENVGRVTPW